MPSPKKIDTSPTSGFFLERNLSTPHGYSDNRRNDLNHFATHYSTPEFDAADGFFSVNKGTLHVNYAQTDYLAFHTATHPRQDPLEKGKKPIMIHFNLVVWLQVVEE